MRLSAARGHEVTGLDTGFHRVGWLYNGVERSPTWIDQGHPDAHRRGPARLRRGRSPGRAVERSGRRSSNPDITYEINHHGSVRLATLAKRGRRPALRLHVLVQRVRRGRRRPPAPRRPTSSPLTAYAKCKVLVERDVAPLAADDFSPTFLRNATAFGASPRMRFDLVVNDLAGHAWTEKSSGWTATARRGGRSSTSSTSARPRLVLRRAARRRSTARSSTSATTAELPDPRDRRDHRRHVPGLPTEFGDSAGDDRNYRANFDKIHERLPVRDPLRRRSRRAAAARRIPRRRHDDRPVRVPRAHPDQADPAPARDAARSTTVLLGRPARAILRPPATRRRRMKAAGRPGRLLPDRPRPGSATTAGSSRGSGTTPGPSELGLDTAERPDQPVVQPASRHDPRAALAGRSPTASRSCFAARAAPSSTSPSTCAPTRRRTASGRATSSTPSPRDGVRAGRLRPWLPGAGGRRRGQLPGLASLRSRRRARVRWDDPALAIVWPITEA